MGWVLLAVLLCVLWVRSYYYYDFGTREIVSMRGNLYISQLIAIAPRYTSEAKFVRTMLGTQAVPAADWVVNPLDGFTIPHGLLGVAAVLLATAPWLRFRFRFSLRTLLIVMTLFALLLGLIVYASR